MATDPDAMWKPGYLPSGPSEPRVPDPPSPVGRSNEAQRSRHRLLTVGAVAALVIVGLAIAVVVTRPDGTTPDVGEISAVDERSIPATVEARWTTRLPGTGSAISTGLEVDGDDLVVVVVDDGSRDRTSITGLDAATGDERWRRSFSFSPPEVRVLDIVDERIILEQMSPSSRKLFALATTDGTTAWEHDPSEWSSGLALSGTALVTRTVSTEGASARFLTTDLLDPMTGVVVGSVGGRPITSDLSGTWLFGGTGDIVSIDLSAGWTEPVAVSVGGVSPEETIASVDDRYLLLDELGSLVELVVDPDDPHGVRRPLTIDGGLSELDSIFPTGGQTFVGVGRGVVVGAQLDGDTVHQTWQMQASVRTGGVTRSGVVLALSEAGAGFANGVDFVVVDAVTGERLAASGPAPSDEQIPLIVGDGFIITRSIVDGRERIGYALDGTELWRLPVTGTLRVGDGIVATLNNTPSGFEVSIFGPDELGPGGTVGGNG